MGLLRKVAARVVGRVRGRQDAPPASGAAASSSAAPLQNAAALAHIECGAQELKERLDAGETVVIVDVRPSAGPSAGLASLPWARRIPLDQLATRWSELADADEIVCVCADGSASLQAARLLRERGLMNATCLDGGLSGWTAVGGQLVGPDQG